MTDFLSECEASARSVLQRSQHLLALFWLREWCVATHHRVYLLTWLAPSSKFRKRSHNAVTNKNNFHAHFDAGANFNAFRSHKPVLMANDHAQTCQAYQNSE
jgi:hypothetical protein